MEDYDLGWERGYNKGYKEGIREFAEFMTRLDYPNAIDKAVRIRVNSLINMFEEKQHDD